MLTSLFYVTGEFYGSYTQDAISPVGEDIETREINVQLTLKTQM